MQNYKYLIVGGGLTGDAAVRGIRELDPTGSIGMFSMEQDPPYDRPDLSKSLWKGKSIEKIWRNTEALKVDLHLGRKVTQLDLAVRQVLDDGGETSGFEKLLLATGGSPNHLTCGGGDIIYFRDLADYRRLRALSDSGQSFVVIGGGFIGSEIAAALTTVGRKVSMILQEDGIGAKLFPPALSQHLNDYYRQKGVEVLTGDAVDNVVRRGTRFEVQTRNGRILEVDGVVAGIGIRPSLELATQAGMEIGDGIIVDKYLLTSAANVFAAGDVANYFQPALGKRVRVEHEDNALFMGKQAGRNMAGASEPYERLSNFYSDLFELGYEAVGEISSKLETVIDWEDPLKKGIIYYLEAGRVRGVLMWNVWKQVDNARALIAEPGPFSAEDLLVGGGSVKQPAKPVLER
ncbi:MAG TPA: FAD-dependent oxidoreductase [Anaerolineales bacterium]|nr:FAD-dependent oxidoreductase [Anaerolineales bacterium]